MGYALIGIVSGVVSGLGIGGGTILIPALAIFFGMGQQEAQSVNLLYFLPTAAIAIATHLKEGNILKKEAVRLSLWGLAAAALGSFIAIKVDANLLRKGFGFFLLAMGAYEIFGKDKQQERKVYMDLIEFKNMKQQFTNADVDAKIDMYISANGLTQTQYRELLQLFPLRELHRLEAAMG